MMTSYKKTVWLFLQGVSAAAGSQCSQIDNHGLLAWSSLCNKYHHSTAPVHGADFHNSYTQTAEGLPPETVEAILSHKVHLLCTLLTVSITLCVSAMQLHPHV